ncbi:MAG TPA: tetratricopeptide repeat protein, partial [Acidobacteriota bacterium]|nr:tetratricopeptide repeat protein [Acidobacteriota bacterium]
MKNIRTLLSSACCLGLSLGLTLEVSARQTPDVLKLEVGQTQILQGSGGQKYRLPFTVKANHYIHLSVNQQGIDVVLRLFSPDGKEVDMSDEPNGNQGFERVKWISAEAGTYELRIEATDSAAAAARCLVRFEALRPATELDRSVMEIDHLNEQVQRLFLEGKIDTALEVMLKGLALAEKNLPPDSEMLAQCLNNLASLYFTKGEFAKAEPVYERAL